MLQKLNFKPGFNKQATASGAESQWIDGDNVRFRYGLPEKIGGWSQLTLANQTLPGVARAQHSFTSLAGEKYTAIGTSQGLFLYYSNEFYDITPLDTAITGATFDSTTGSATVTVNKIAHNLNNGRYITFTSVSLPGGGETNFTTAQFQNNTFEVLNATANAFEITMPANEGGTGMSAQGSTEINPYVQVGPIFQLEGFGWGAGLWGASTWGTARSTAAVVLDPGNWSLDNFGEVLVATIHNGKTFTWDAGASNARTVRASTTTTNYETTNNPTASIMTIVSDRDRHLFHLGTETTIGDNTTQDPMFIRFSNQEDLNTYLPTATNTAGTFRLDQGNEIRAAIQGKDYVLILTDTAAYTVQFVGPPFTFSIRQVGVNCGAMGQHAVVYANGVVYWMGDAGGFFAFDGTVKSLPCLVEDFVFTTGGDNLGINYNAGEIVYAGLNHLYEEVNWFYAKAGSQFIDRVVTYNYTENTWTTGTLDRTSWHDSTLYDNPYATKYNGSGTPSFPTIQGVTSANGATTYYAHEIGNNEVDALGNKTAIPAFIQSGDFDLAIEGDGQMFMSMKRFVPDFKLLTGNAQVTIKLRDYPSDTAASSPLGPFTINSSTDKVDTRARSRFASLRIANTSTDENWRFGTFRADIQPDGMRG